ncbi:hypothetical protein [Corallococcus carmarthensis]|uniref:hypothetical protein n=1 Tax=Corallococcus carmarthensis TaxID=2316728 RepID=UPI0011C44E0B|nr:hypothetical protein [Corallococcus carmarthensis]
MSLSTSVVDGFAAVPEKTWEKYATTRASWMSVDQTAPSTWLALMVLPVACPPAPRRCRCPR